MVALPYSLDPAGISNEVLYDLLSNVKDVVNELQTDHATFRTGVTALETLINQLRSQSLYRALGNPAFAIDTMPRMFFRSFLSSSVWKPGPPVPEPVGSPP